jgi:hypothetical protein
VSGVAVAQVILDQTEVVTPTRETETNLSERWTLTPADRALIAAKSRANWLSFAVLLLFFRERGRFPVGR